jgi:hypothetical protein
MWRSPTDKIAPEWFIRQHYKSKLLPRSLKKALLSSLGAYTTPDVPLTTQVHSVAANREQPVI